MKELPILFSAPMVRAILAGQKTQTRRVVKPAPQMVTDRAIRPWDGDQSALLQLLLQSKRGCPYGQPGDQLWVRETWGVVSGAWDDNGALIEWTPDRPATPISEMPFGNGYYSGHAIYAADGDYHWSGDDDGGGEPRSAWHPSIHMPRAASRILLEVASVRVERLQDISDEDCFAEGWPGRQVDGAWKPSSDFEFRYEDVCDSRAWYRDLWGRINGSGSWDANPWVWVIEFKHEVGKCR